MKILKKILYAIVILLPILAIYLSPRVIKATKLSCSSQFGPCNEEINASLEGAKGKSIHESKEIIATNLEKDININDYSLRYKIPNELEIDILVKKPIYGLRQGASGKIAEVAKEGEVVSHVDSTSLPVLVVEDEIPSAGERVSSNRLFALKLLHDVSSQYQIDQANIEGQSLVIDLSDSIEVIFPLEGDRQVLTGSLNLILAQLNSESEDFRINNTSNRVLDLRLKNPVLR